MTLFLKTSSGLSGPVLRDTVRLSQLYPPIARYGIFSGRGQKWQRNGPQKWIFEGVFHYFFFFGAIFFCHFFALVQLGAVFHFDFHFFLHFSGVWPFSMPYLPGRIPKQGGNTTTVACENPMVGDPLGTILAATSCPKKSEEINQSTGNPKRIKRNFGQFPLNLPTSVVGTAKRRLLVNPYRPEIQNEFC